MRRRLYISGAISGKEPAEVEKVFGAAAQALYDAEYAPLDPRSIQPICLPDCDGVVDGYGAHYHCLLRGDLREMLTCDGVALLPGWASSRGARIERSVALHVGLPVRNLTDWLTEESNPASRCWCGSEVGVRTPGDVNGLGCLAVLEHEWRDASSEVEK